MPTVLKCLASFATVLVTTVLIIEPALADCAAKVLVNNGGDPPTWWLDCTGDLCCTRQPGWNAEIGDYKFCSCDANEPVCCHIVLDLDDETGVATGKGKNGYCSAQQQGCPTGDECNYTPQSVEPPWTGGWVASCYTG